MNKATGFQPCVNACKNRFNIADQVKQVEPQNCIIGQTVVRRSYVQLFERDIPDSFCFCLFAANIQHSF